MRWKEETKRLNLDKKGAEFKVRNERKANVTKPNVVELNEKEDHRNKSRCSTRQKDGNILTLSLPIRQQKAVYLHKS